MRYLTLLLLPSFSCFLNFAICQNPSTNSAGQVITVQPKIMAIPYTKEGEDLRTILEADENKKNCAN